MKWKKYIFTFLTRKRRFFGWFIHLNSFTEKAFSNQNNHHLSNGESFLQKSTLQFGFQVIFDVGANVGDWSKRIAELMPSACVYAFEPIPMTFQKLEANLSSFSNIKTQKIGLSDQNKKVNFYQFAENSLFSSQFDRIEFLDKIEVKVVLEKGDDFCSHLQIHQIDLMKIDVEGLEMSVLNGFERMLTSSKIKLIQFEYGPMNIEARSFLKDFFDYLQPLGYMIGKLFPDGVEFKSYHYKMDDFKWANYVAVLKTEVDLIKNISV